jgi:hypothetical protein
MLWLRSGTAADYHATPDNYRDYLRRLAPGDRLLLSPGDYLRGLPLRDLAGSAKHPVLIEGSAHTHFIAEDGANTVSLRNVRHVTIRTLELDGRNLPVDAVKAEGDSSYADFVTLENLDIHDYAASQQNVGISTKCPAYGWIVRNNRINRVGTGMYFGNSDGNQPFVAGLIEGNRIADTRGYNLQIKHQHSRPTDYPARSMDTVIRHNLFSKQHAPDSAEARPNLLLGHLPLTGAGSLDRYLVYGNLFLQNPSEALMQAEGRVAIYDNVFINDDGDALHIQPHNDEPRDMLIFSNTVIASGTGIRVRQRSDTPYRQRVVANWVQARTPIIGGSAAYNTTRGYTDARYSGQALHETASLSAAQSPALRLPTALRRELAAYPGWQWRAHAGADPDRDLRRLLDASSR